MPTTKKNNLLEYKGHPLMRKENIIYYGSMSDSHIIMMQILESSDYKGLRWILHPSGSAEHCTRSKTSPQLAAAV